MIVVQTSGGLGNQLFQYALGRCLAHRHEVPLYLDTQLHKSRHHRDFALADFQIRIDTIPKKKLKRLLKPRLWRSPKLQEVREQHEFCFDGAVLELPSNVYLKGYWQSEKYFKPVESILRNEFQVRHPLEGKNLQFAQEIARHNAVSIHIRRGDYVTIPSCHVLPLDYYQRAISDIATQVEDPHFYIFSNDPTWAKENLHLPYPTCVVDHNDEAAGFEDLRLMSLCKHHIIANSSFSWWGAYLGSHPEKIVYAPDPWFGKGETPDLLPPSWKRF